jgi:hypothetical protein
MSKKNRECVYCDYPERFNLTAATVSVKFNGFPREEVIRWHEEAVQHLAGVPKRRVRCQRQ